MTIDARIVRVVTRPNGVLLHLDAYPGKLGIVKASHTPAVGQRVSGDETSALVWDGVEGQASMISSYERKGLRLYERSGADE